MKPSLFSTTVVLLLFTAIPLPASGWIPFTTTPRTGAAAFDQFGAVVASNGFDYVAAWTSSTPFNPKQATSVCVARVNADGSLHDPVASPLDPTAMNARGVGISAGRDGYFASWISEKGLNAAVLDSFGRVERQVTVPQDTGSAVARTLTAWNGAVHLTISGFNGPFIGTLFDDSGEVLASNIAIGDTHGDGMTRVALTDDSEGFLVLATKRASDTDDIYGRRITSSGVAGEWFPVRSVVTQVLGLSVAWDGARDVIAWGDSFGVWTMDLDPRSNAMGPSRQLVPDAATVGRVLRQSNRTWITYGTTVGNAYAITIGADGIVSAPLLLGGGDPGDLAWNGTRVLNVRSIFQVAETAEYDVAGRFLSPAADAPFIVARSETDQQNGDLAADDRGNVVSVWDEKTSQERQIFAERFDAMSKPADPAGVQISSSGDNTHPAVAFNGTSYLVVWTRTIDFLAQTVARRFSMDGRVLDTEDIMINDGNRDSGPRVASDGTNWLVVSPRAFGAGCGGLPGSRLFATRVSAAGVVLDGEGIAIPPLDGLDQTEGDLAWTGSQYVATWRDLCAGYRRQTSTSISSAWIAADLTRIEVASLTGQAQGPGYSAPRIAAGPVRSLVAWQSAADTEYRIIGSAPSPLPARRRAAGDAPAELSIPNVLLLDASRDPSGQLVLLISTTIPWAAPAQGVFQRIIHDDGTPGTTSFLFVLDSSEQLTGKSVLHAGRRWMAETQYPSIFDPAAGARRGWIREFEP